MLAMIKHTCELWEDVLDPKFDGFLAPEPGSEESIVDEDVKRIYFDAREFFQRTYFTENMVRILEDVVEAFNGGSKRTFAVTSLFGGGKSHTLLAIMHAFKSPESLRDSGVLSFYDSNMAGKLIEISKRIAELKDVEVVVISGKYERSGGMSPLTPATIDGRRIKTVWGYLAFKLDKYDELRNYDESEVVPSSDILTGVLSGRKTLILVDEILEPTIKLSDTARGYKKQLLQFVEYLVKAVTTANSVMIVTLPFNIQGGEIRGYDGSYSREYVDQLYKRLKDVGEFIPPVSVASGDLSRILQRRFFKKIDLESAKPYITELADAYSAYPEIFGSQDYAKRILEGYPLHPEMIEILKTIVERADLMKTRDMLRIGRKIVRAVWNAPFDPYLLMPWHIPEMEGAEDLLFKGLEGYKAVFTDSVEKSAENFQNPQLARAALRTIFLKTYPYDQRSKSDTFPNKRAIAWMVYEPDLFRGAGINPPSVISFLQALEGDVRVQYLYDHDGVFWFYRTRGIRESIAREQDHIYSERINDVRARFAEYIDALSKGKKIGHRKSTPPKSLYAIKTNRVTVLGEYDELTDEFDDYTVVFLSYPVNLTESTERTDPEYLRIKDLIFKAGKNTRSNKNTVIVAYSTNEARLDDCLKHVSGILACEKISKDPRAYMEDIEDEDEVEYYRNRVEKFKDEFIDKFIRAVFSAFEYVAYPRYEENQDAVGVFRMQTGAGTLLEEVVQTLEHPSVQKIIRDIKTFSTLRDVLREAQKIDLEEGMREYRVGEIFDKFIKHPGMLIAEKKDLDIALKEGVKNLRIGILDEDGHLFFKKFHDLKEGGTPRQISETGSVPGTIKKDYRILPWKLAVERFVEEIRADIARERDETVEYKVQIGDELIDIDAILSDAGWHDTICLSPVVRIVKTIKGPRARLSLNPGSISGKPGEEREVTVEITLEDPDNTGKAFVVEIYGEGDFDRGSFKLYHGETGRATWRVKIPDGGGSIFLPLNVKIDGEDKLSRNLKIAIETGITVTDEIKSEHAGMYLIKITGITDEYSLERINTISEQFKLPEPRASGSISSSGGGIIDISIQRAPPRKALELVNVIKGLSNHIMELEVEFGDSFTLDDLLVPQLAMLNGNVKFHIKE
ncbi:hypothetical protein DRN98_04070 [Methanosarcinales archaeon]|nr:MAG: hypothetical protein DRN98_04070 [Methanosarcinales archaeon]